MPIPLNNYYVGRKLREVSSYNNSSMDLLDNAVPAIILNPNNAGVEVQPALPKANSNQSLKYSTIHVNGTATDYQLATVTSTKRVYFLGFMGENDAANVVDMQIWDGTTGTDRAAGFSNNTAYPQETGLIARYGMTATAQTSISCFLPLPVEVTSGLRMTSGGASQHCIWIVYWIEETVYAP